MPKYSVDATNFTTPTGTADTAISLTFGSDEYGETVYLNMTGSGTTTAADTQHHAAAYFCDFTTAGTPGSSPTPELMAFGTRIAGAEADIEYTAEPTNINTVALVSGGFNQRGGFFWAVPQGEGIRNQGGLTEDGLVWTVVSVAAGAVDAHVHWWE
jgi:hypothetical protein